MDDNIQLDIVVGYRFPRGGHPLFPCLISKGETRLGYGVVVMPTPGRLQVHDVRYRVTGGRLRETSEEVKDMLKAYAEKIGMIPVYINNSFEECGLVTDGQSAIESIQTYIREMADTDIVKADRLQDNLNRMLTPPRPTEEVAEEDTEEVEGLIFLLHFDKPYRNAKHFLGFLDGYIGEPLTNETLVQQPLEDRLVEMLNTVGHAGWQITYQQSGTREEFEHIKARRNHGRLCSVCRGVSNANNK